MSIPKSRSLLAFLLIAGFLVGLAALARQDETGASGLVRAADPPLSVDPPPVAVRGIAKITVEADTEWSGPGPLGIEVRDAAGVPVGEAELPAGGSVEVELELGSGNHELEIRAPGRFSGAVGFELKVVSGWLTILPPAIAILVALITRQVIPALLAGVWIGATIATGNPLTGVLRAFDQYILGALSDEGRVAIIIFSMFLGGMVGVMSRSGGTAGLVEALKPYATNTRRGQLVTWVLGLLVFFDDYANTLVVGNTMRPVTDKLRISREKLAYIVDSTAAPVAAIFLVSTWIGYEVSLIDDALEAIGGTETAYTVFLKAIPYNFYPILALWFGFMVASSGRDFGPMLKAERRAAGGRVMSETAVPLADFGGEAIQPVDSRPRRWINAALPVLVVVTVTFVSLWWTGRNALVEAGNPLGTTAFFDLGFSGIGDVFGAGSTNRALLYAASGGCLTAILMALGQRILTLGESLEAMIAGFKSMVLAFVILTLAWAISDVCAALNTSGFMTSALSDKITPAVLPSLVFLLAAVTAFSTGSSWSTMGILIPISVPTAYGVAQAAGYSSGAAEGILLGSVASVLAGAIFGDHCSPISDTTVLSSMSSGCDHVDHVRTQLPYALLVGAVGILLGGLPTGFGAPVWVGLLLSAAALWIVLRLFGRHSVDAS
jgi:Na+/H+ antiporter NhaC